MDTLKGTKKILWKEETFLPPLSSPSNNQSDVSSTRQSSRLHSSSTLRSSLSSRSTSSAQSGGSTLEKKREETKSAASSVNSETLAIAIELSKLKARRDKDERETLARILDSSDHFGSFLARRSSTAAPRPHSKMSPQNAIKTPPPTRMYTGPGVSILNNTV